MEYRRNRKRNYRNKKESGGGGKALTMIILLAAAVYFVSVSAAGSWLSKHIVEPVFSAFTKDDVKKSEADTSIYTVNTSSELDIPTLKCYLIQMAVFSEKDRAEEMSNSLREQGGAGYVYEDNGKYRVFAAGYASEDDAKAVKQNILDKGMDCSIHELSMTDNKYDISVTAGTDSTISETQTAFYAIMSAHDDLMELEKNFDANNMTASDGVKAAKAIYEGFSDSVKDKAALPDEVRNCINLCMDALEGLCKSESLSHAEFSSKLKYTQITFACEFIKTVKELVI